MKQLRIFQNAKFRAKSKSLKFGTKNALFWYFWTGILKTIVISEINALEFVLLQSWVQKKSLNMGPKMPDLVIFGLEFENNIFKIEICALKFVLLQSLVKNRNH